MRSDLFHDVHYRVTAIATRGNVKKRKFVGTLFVVTPRNSDGISGIADIDKFDTLDDTSGIHVQTRNNTFREHR